jgi:CubicO group peptidase (beta-lactamase class C family)
MFNSKLLASLMGILLGASGASAQRQKPLEDPLPDRVARLVAPLIDSRSVVGLSIGLIDGEKSWTMGYGFVSSEFVARPDATTIYEIGSITKSFTGILLADAIERGNAVPEHGTSDATSSIRLKLDSRVAEFLPDSVRTGAFGSSGATILDLATHYSGLPSIPYDFAPGDPGNPYADYSASKMLASLESVPLLSKPGEHYSYSNLGMGLLGWLLARQSGTDYAELLRRRVTAPLGMGNTAIALAPELSARLAEGHDADGEVVPNWDFDALAGAGAIRSNVEDMLLYLKANLGITRTSIRAAIDAAQKPQRALENGGSIALGWHILPQGKVIWHNGETAGYHSIIAFNREKRQGVIVLANTSSPLVDRLGIDLLKLLDGGNPTPLSLPAVTPLDTATLGRYVGRYGFASGGIMKITRERDRLYGQLDDQAPLRIYPTSETEFFLRAVDARISFVRESDGRVTALILHQNGFDQTARRE